MRIIFAPAYWEMNSSLIHKMHPVSTVCLVGGRADPSSPTVAHHRSLSLQRTLGIQKERANILLENRFQLLIPINLFSFLNQHSLFCILLLVTFFSPLLLASAVSSLHTSQSVRHVDTISCKRPSCQKQEKRQKRKNDRKRRHFPKARQQIVCGSNALTWSRAFLTVLGYRTAEKKLLKDLKYTLQRCIICTFANQYFYLHIYHASVNC